MKSASWYSCSLTAARVCLAVSASLAVAGCGAANRVPKDPSPSKRMYEYGEPIPEGGGVYKIGKPYRIRGQWYHPKEDPDYREHGVASWYGHAFHGRYTANGEIFDMDSLSAAHRTMPLPSYAKVTNVANGRSIVVRVNDRGPYAHDRIIDLSKRAAQMLGFEHQGTARVDVAYLEPAPLSGGEGWALSTPGEMPVFDREVPVDFAQGDVPLPYTDTNRHDSSVPVLPVVLTQHVDEDSDQPDMTDDGGFHVQVASLHNAVGAQHLALRLRRAGYPANIRPAYVDGLLYYRIRVGPLYDQQRAEEALRFVSHASDGGQVTDFARADW